MNRYCLGTIRLKFPLSGVQPTRNRYLQFPQKWNNTDHFLDSEENLIVSEELPTGIDTIQGGLTFLP